MTEETRHTQTTPDASDSDSDFVVESYSAPFAPAPDDTTVRASVAAPPEPVSTPETPAETPAEPDHDEPPASQVSALATETPPAVASAPSTSVKGKKGPTLAERNAQLRREVDRSTYELRETQRRIADAKRELDTFSHPRAEAKPEVKAEAPAETPMPAHPKYKDYETDEAYETAVAAWHTAISTWQTSRESAVEARITKGLDARFESERGDAETRRQQATIAARLETARAKYPDWSEKSEALKGLVSSWYNPADHGDAAAPFLSDLAMSLMAQDNAEGADLLYFLGEDPDRAQVLADLVPSRALRDALVSTPSVLPLLEHFATDDGAKAFEALARMQPIRCIAAVGALSARLAAAPRDSASAAHSITKAVPPAKSPVGAPGARGAAPAGPLAPFEEWMAHEDAKELAKRKQMAGIAS